MAKKITSFSLPVILLSVGVFLCCLVLSEFVLLRFWPIADPYAALKIRKHIKYIASEHPANFRFITYTEKGLPGFTRTRRIFTTNNLGFRGSFLEMPKPVNEFRVFMIGGSTTECLYLDDSEVVSRILEKELGLCLKKKGLRVKVYNAGKTGDRIDDNISMLVHRIIHLSPDLIILFPGINDLFASLYGFDYLHVRKSFLNSIFNENLNLSMLLRMTATEFQIGRRVYYLLKAFTPKTDKEVYGEITKTSNYREKAEFCRAMPESQEVPRPNIAAYRNNLRSFIGVCQAHKIKLLLMTQAVTWGSRVDPETAKWQWLLCIGGKRYNALLMARAMESINDVTRDEASYFGLPLYDLAVLIPKSLDYFYDDVHFNIKGAEFAGQRLARFICENNLVN